MSYVKLDKAFTHGYLKTLRFYSGDKRKPPTGHMWLVISGMLYHVNGTDTMFSVKDAEGNAVFRTTIESAQTTRPYPLFNTVASLHQAQQPPFLLVDDTMTMQISAGGTTNIHLVMVLEWKK